MAKRRTKKYKMKKKNKKTKKKNKKINKKRQKNKQKKMKGGGWTDNVLNIFRTEKKAPYLEYEINPENNDKKCPTPKGVMEQIEDFSKEQTETLVNTLNKVNVNIKKTAKQQVGRTFNNLMNAMVSKSEKENVCPCCKRPYTDKEKVPMPKAGDEAPKAGDEAPKAGDEAPKAGDVAKADYIPNENIMKQLAKPKARDDANAGDETNTAKELSDEPKQL